MCINYPFSYRNYTIFNRIEKILFKTKSIENECLNKHTTINIRNIVVEEKVRGCNVDDTHSHTLIYNKNKNKKKKLLN